MVQVAVGEKNGIETLKTNAAPQELTLRTLADIHDKPMFIVEDKGRWQAAPDRGRGRGGTEKNKFKQWRAS